MREKGQPDFGKRPAGILARNFPILGVFLARFACLRQMWADLGEQKLALNLPLVCVYVCVFVKVCLARYL